MKSLTALENRDAFSHRHIGPGSEEIRAMLGELGFTSLEQLVAATVPQTLALKHPLALGEPTPETEALAQLQALVAGDRPARSLIGLGYYDTLMPAVIQRNVLENPGWYTAYTPYQAEISQGRLEVLLAFQQMITDLSGMDLANASLLDEGTAAAEAMALARRVCAKQSSQAFFVDRNCFPQTLSVLQTRAASLGFELIIDDPTRVEQHDIFGALFQYPDANGQIRDLSPLLAAVHAQQGIGVVAADLLSLVLLKAPGEMGADAVVGSSQRFGVPMSYGGPHAAYFATRNEYRRAMPGRIIGVSRDAKGKPALRMALQTREQHIRREKANSNICTAQVLLANIAALYAMYHGPQGLLSIARRVQHLTSILAEGLRQQGLDCGQGAVFDTLSLKVGGPARSAILERAASHGINLRCDRDDSLGLSLDECSSTDEVTLLWRILLGDAAANELVLDEIAAQISAGGSDTAIPAALQRQSDFLTHAVFNSHHSETQMLRYLKKLENRDLSLTHAMIPLGSCTMKLNATTEMLPLSWPAFSKPHPFTPQEQTPGYRRMIAELAGMLAEITGFDAVSMQPNSGAQGEYAGLLTIRHYLDSLDQPQRRVCLIPSSAHGTNPASAQMAGMSVVVVACDPAGNIDLADLQKKADMHRDTLAALMLTYPSTHGVFEEGVRDICRLVHECGAQVYLDGANLNALVGLARPGDIGADVCHLNLHKTFCIPHGGGGPGMGPIGVKKHLQAFLPNHPLVTLEGPASRNNAVSAAPWGSAGILPVSWLYIRMMGAAGLLKATQVAILNANYIAHKLEPHYPVLYKGRQGRVAHECIIDLRPLKASAGISEEDLAKRLMDYGFHAPTMSFPVAGTLMIEPTESEAKDELDRFIAAMLSIRQEIARIESGEWDRYDNPLKNAPHTMADIVSANWQRAYSREEAVFPLAFVKDNKFWPSVNRIDNVFGDRNLICGCPPLESYSGSPFLV
ncbi:MAG: aminomethyl-transferring glycine dehydrogenase [Pseudomonadales bacterium]|nr:aminomethyl-transferring glycine dehydrogenase [Pseudomonadales bacterium]